MKNINVDEEEIEMPGTGRKNDDEERKQGENVAFGEPP